MKSVTVKKEELHQTLIKNRTEHRDVFAAAHAKYRDELKAVLVDQVNNLNNGRPVDLSKINGLVVPRNYTKEYDRVISMLEWEEHDVVVLDANDFRRFVQDEWDWSRQWAVSNSSYTSSPKFQQHLGDE